MSETPRSSTAATHAGPGVATRAGEVLSFWFGMSVDGIAEEVIAQRQAPLWWGKADAVDTDIRQRFGPLVERAEEGELADWSGDAHGWLALLVLTDQFPRNIHRDTPRAFALDPLARELCAAGLAAGLDRQLRPIQRVFAYLPLEHAEDTALQQQAVERFEALAREVEPEARETFDGFLDFARRHQVVIDRFGRFPHRNRILGRTSTAEEAAFLQQPGSSF